MYRELVAVLDDLYHPIHLRKAQLRIHAPAIEIHSQRDQTDVAGTLAIAEQTAFNAIGAGHHRQFGAGDAGTAIVMRMHADTHIPAAREVAAKKYSIRSA